MFPPLNMAVDDIIATSVNNTREVFILKDMKRGKAPGENDVLWDVLKDAGKQVHVSLARLFAHWIPQ